MVVTIANGNSGAAGAFFGSTGSSGTNVLAVASVETEVYPASPFELTSTLDGETETVKVFSPCPLNSADLPRNGF